MPDPIAEPNPEPTVGAGGEQPSSATGTTEAEPAAAASDSVATAEKGSSVASGVVAPAGKRGGFGRVLEWFWLGGAVKAVRARGTTLDARGQELLRRARVASELSTRALEPPEPLPSGSAEALACELYRESIEWSLAAHQTEARQAAKASESGTKADLETLWNAADAEFLSKAAGGATNLAKLHEDVRGRTYREFADLDATEQNRIARSLRQFAEGLTNTLDATQNDLDRLWLKRLFRLGLLLGGVLGISFLVSEGLALSETGKDLAVTAGFTASSLYAAEPGCSSPKQECAGSPNFFIHTNEEHNPWLMFDLGAEKSFSGVRVENRLDCCYERANPVVVEVSSDAQKWQEVARRTSEFSSWKATFPKVKARYVKFSIPKRTNLHFSRVRILP